MNILVIHAHTSNRGDEAAVKAMVDEFIANIPDVHITISINGDTFYPNMPDQVDQIPRIPAIHSLFSKICFMLFYMTNGHISVGKEMSRFKKILAKTSLVVHAPGGPSIGDIYRGAETIYLLRLNLMRKMKIPYVFYAPSMGPFNDVKANSLRKRVLEGAAGIVVRDPISLKYVREFVPNVKVKQTLDSALQHDVDVNNNQRKLDEYEELSRFLKSFDKVIGVTVTDLKWHPTHGKTNITKKIPQVFKEFVDERAREGYGIVFIPQLYGSKDDTTLMNEFMRADGSTFMIEANDPQYDTYFQQFVISKLYAVVGMRYHSNIFSAKGATPFVSVSYEQKMQGFMDSMNLEDYCLPIADLSVKKLDEKFRLMVKNYDNFEKLLIDAHGRMKKHSFESTEMVLDAIQGENND